MASEQPPEPDYALHYVAFNDLSEANYARAAVWYRWLLADVLRGLPPSARILDVGCGPGLLVESLLKSGFTAVTGIDTSESLVSEAKKRGLPVHHVSADYIDNSPSNDDTAYDVIFLLDVLEHVSIPRQLSFLRGIRRRLRDQGRLVVSVPNANSSLASRWRYIDWTHTTAFTESSLRFVLGGAGFTAVRLLPHEFHMRPRLPFLVRSGVLHWWLHLLMRGFRRLEMVGELGSQGWTIPLSLNLLAVASVAPDLSSAGRRSVVT